MVIHKRCKHEFSASQCRNSDRCGEGLRVVNWRMRPAPGAGLTVRMASGRPAPEDSGVVRHGQCRRGNPRSPLAYSIAKSSRRPGRRRLVRGSKGGAAKLSPGRHLQLLRPHKPALRRDVAGNNPQQDEGTYRFRRRRVAKSAPLPSARTAPGYGVVTWRRTCLRGAVITETLRTDIGLQFLEQIDALAAKLGVTGYCNRRDGARRPGLSEAPAVPAAGADAARRGRSECRER